MVMNERRISPRHRILKTGTLKFPGGMVACTVRNISQSGARLDIVNPLGVPKTFLLVIISEQLTRQCRPVWACEGKMGVAFD